MVTAFGKFLRILREILKDMAEKLNVTSSFLSAVENGKKNPLRLGKKNHQIIFIIR